MCGGSKPKYASGHKDFILVPRLEEGGQHSSFILVCVKSVPRYDFKLAYVVLQMVVKEFFETHF